MLSYNWEHVYNLLFYFLFHEFKLYMFLLSRELTNLNSKFEFEFVSKLPFGYITNALMFIQTVLLLLVSNTRSSIYSRLHYQFQSQNSRAVALQDTKYDF